MHMGGSTVMRGHAKDASVTVHILGTYILLGAGGGTIS